MAKDKYDGVVEAVHYGSDGYIKWVRSYLRRGPIFSDRVMLDRQTLVEHLKAGKKYLVGQRKPYLAGTFEVSEPLRLVQKNGNEIIVVGEVQSNQDHLMGVPIV